MSGVAAISLLTSASPASSPVAEAVGPYATCTASPPSSDTGTPAVVPCPPTERVETVFARGIGYGIYEPGPLTLSPIMGLHDASAGICDAARRVARSGLEEKIQAIRASNPGKVVTVEFPGLAEPRGYHVYDGTPRPGGLDTGTWASVGKPKWYSECSVMASATVIVSDPPSATPPPAPTATNAPAATPAPSPPAPLPPPPAPTMTNPPMPPPPPPAPTMPPPTMPPPTMPPPSSIPANTAGSSSPSLPPTMAPPAPIPPDTLAAPTTTIPATTSAAPTSTVPPNS